MKEIFGFRIKADGCIQAQPHIAPLDCCRNNLDTRIGPENKFLKQLLPIWPTAYRTFFFGGPKHRRSTHT
jgi:hypothetical protein